MGVLERIWHVVKLLGNIVAVAYLASRVLAGENAWYVLAPFIALGAHSVIESLHELVADRQERRREAQLTWAIRWHARHRPDGWYPMTNREQIAGRLVRNLRVVR